MSRPPARLTALQLKDIGRIVNYLNGDWSETGDVRGDISLKVTLEDKTGEFGHIYKTSGRTYEFVTSWLD